jgi:putative ABC transport system ATP-binding protein
VTAPLIDVKGLGKTFPVGERSLTVLDGLDLSVAEGEFLALRGASGSGKSTLLHILGCLDRPTVGQYHFAGQPLHGLDDETLSRFRADQVGFVFQSFHLLPQMSAFDNVALAFMYGDKDRANLAGRVAEALARVGLAERMHHFPNQLSGGEMQRVAIARAVVGRPRLLLADEPTGNLDSENGRQILELLQALNREGTTLVLVTHDADIAARAGRRLLIRDGRFVGQGDAV